MRLLSLIPTLLLLGGCAMQSTQPTTIITDWDKHQQQLEQLQTWRLEGKLGYHDSRDGGSAWVNWQQSAENFKLQLNGPFGAGATHIIGDDHSAELQRSGKETIYASSPAALTEQLFGWQWPVDQLQFWIRGIPAPNTPLAGSHHNPDGTLADLDQAQWQLEFSRYQQVDRWILPSRIRGNSGEYSFTLVIKSWQPSPVVD